MSTEKITNKIKLKGYWRVVIRPTQFEKLRIKSFSDIRKIVQDCSVSLGGWDYPHFEERIVQNKDDWVELSLDWENIIEHWRFFRSGQFFHLFALYEDQIDMISVLPYRSPPRVKRAGYIYLTSIIYKVTEIFEFASRLANKGIFGSTILISISLYNINDHELVSERVFLHDGYVYNDDNPIVFTKEISAENLITKANDLAQECIVEIFERFQWNAPSLDLIKQYQKQLIERKI